jgi:hypothetical protein
MSEEKEKPKKDRIKTVQDGIFRCELDLLRLDETGPYLVSLADQMRREIGTLQEPHRSKFKVTLETILADKDYEKTRMKMYNELMTAGQSGNYPIADIQKIVETPTERRIIGKLMALQSEYAYLLDESGVKPVMGERGKSKFEAKYGKVNDAGIIVKE